MSAPLSCARLSSPMQSFYLEAWVGGWEIIPSLVPPTQLAWGVVRKRDRGWFLTASLGSAGSLGGANIASFECSKPVLHPFGLTPKRAPIQGVPWECVSALPVAPSSKSYFSCPRAWKFVTLCLRVAMLGGWAHAYFLLHVW